MFMRERYNFAAPKYDERVKTWAVAFVMVVAATVEAAPKKLPWMKPPGPIEGRWRATCAGADGMIIAVTVDGKKASGKVEDPGAGAKYGYAKGEEILRLEADDYGDWVGQLEWRSVAGVTRWDPIRFSAVADVLDATMATSECYRKMPRVKLGDAPK
jgi:hypothetical protein